MEAPAPLRGIALGGTRPGIAAAQADATTRVLAFLHAHLGRDAWPRG